MTTHHLSPAAGFRAACGHLADGKEHTNEIGPVLRAMAAEHEHFNVCPDCLTAPHDEQRASL